MKAILLEALLVSALCAVLAFAANALSPKGLKLSRNYFPTASIDTAGATNGAPVPSGSTNYAAVLRAKGLQPLDTPAVLELFHDARYQQNLILFVDARDNEHYQAGHIPGAYEFDHYRPEAYLGTVLPLCLAAEKVVIYCNGGDCEDSQFAALFLRDAGVSAEKLFVYLGGIAEWKTNNLPVAVGPEPNDAH